MTVSGWRKWEDPRFIIAHLERMLIWYGDGQIHLRVGCCPTGVDKHVRDWAVNNRPHLSSFTVYYADWNKLGRRAGPIRNGFMLRGQHHSQEPNPGVVTDVLLAFPQPGLSWWIDNSGTIGCIRDAVSLAVHLDVPGYRLERRERAYF